MTSPPPSTVAALVGMPGSGKSEVASFFREQGWTVVRFGDVTEEELERRGWEQTPKTERRVREELRAEEGMDAYARRCVPRIDRARARGPVAVDGLYSWEEYLVLRERYGPALAVVAVHAPPALRYERLAARPVRPLTPEEAFERDRAEIEKINKGGPIAMADRVLLNSGSLAELRSAALGLAGRLGERS